MGTAGFKSLGWGEGNQSFAVFLNFGLKRIKVKTCIFRIHHSVVMSAFTLKIVQLELLSDSSKRFQTLLQPYK